MKKKSSSRQFAKDIRLAVVALWIVVLFLSVIGVGLVMLANWVLSCFGNYQISLVVGVLVGWLIFIRIIITPVAVYYAIDQQLGLSEVMSELKDK